MFVYICNVNVMYMSSCLKWYIIGDHVDIRRAVVGLCRPYTYTWVECVRLDGVSQRYRCFTVLFVTMTLCTLTEDRDRCA